MTPRLLDLFCGAGGAGFGYHLAGFEVVGVDIEPQKNYPFEFHQGDALEFLIEHGAEFDAIHASPPCQGYSRLRFLPRLKDREYPLHIPRTRLLLSVIGKPWVIENVAGSPLQGGELCGVALGMTGVTRHRRFESSMLFLFPPCPGHPVLYPGKAQMSAKGRHGGVMGILPGFDARRALGVEWMTLREARQAIPPAYTEWIGRQLLEALP